MEPNEPKTKLKDEDVLEVLEKAQHTIDGMGKTIDDLNERIMEIQSEYYPEWRAFSAPRFFERIKTELRTLDAVRYVASKQQAQFTALKLRFAMLEDWQYRACDLLIDWPDKYKDQRQVAIDLYNEWAQEKGFRDGD